MLKDSSCVEDEEETVQTTLLKQSDALKIIHNKKNKLLTDKGFT